MNSFGLARKVYLRARKRALARLRKGIDLRWTLTRSLDEIHQGLKPGYPKGP